MREALFVACVMIATGVPLRSGASPAGNIEIVIAPWTYATSPLRVPEGKTLVFANFDSISGEGHSLTHAVPAGAERFKSPITPPGTTATVEGVEKLDKGSYSFTCRIHPFMAGTLVID